MKHHCLTLTGACLIGLFAGAGNAEEAKAGVVTSHSRGLHGYIGFDASRPKDRSEFSAGMGFYSAVWPLVSEPIAHFQIGLPSACTGAVTLSSAAGSPL